jgi:hypothetical protein
MPAERSRKTDAAVVRAVADLAIARNRFSVSVGALEREVARRFDWRAWVARKPVMALGLAFGLGMFLGRRR